jgi:outer membrane protein TolC
MESQNWTGAFGALYLANMNWDFFSFGRIKERINVSKAMVARDEFDLEQEKFQQQVRVAGAYLNLLAAQRLTRSQQNNLERASGLRAVVVNLTKNGLNAGVDSSLANAQVSSAKIELVRALDFEQEQANQLALLMGVTEQQFALDSVFLTRIPATINDSVVAPGNDHPTLKFFRSLVEVSDIQTRFFRTLNYPTFSLFTVIQGRGSGFDYNYGEQYPEAYSPHYWQGVKPTRGNYLAGIGFVWNLTTPLRNQQQIAAQKFTSTALANQVSLAENQIRNQLLLAQNKIRNAMANYREAPVQVKAAQDAYLQKSVLYKNGLSNIVDVTQALFALNRAETDRDIAYGNVWQALLLKAAASGDFGIFINEF